MQNKKNKLLKIIDSNYALFDLKDRASKIKNDFLIKDCINSLMNFVQSDKNIGPSFP